MKTMTHQKTKANQGQNNQLGIGAKIPNETIGGKLN